MFGAGVFIIYVPEIAAFIISGILFILAIIFFLTARHLSRFTQASAKNQDGYDSPGNTQEPNVKNVTLYLFDKGPWRSKR